MIPRGRAVLALFFLLHAAHGAVSLPSWLGSGMVVQRDKPILLRGSVAAGEDVRITQGEASVVAKAGADGSWSAQLPARNAGPIPDIVIESGNKIVLTDLLAGDVWFASGQSNMEFKLRRAAGADAEIPEADHESIRLFKVGRQISKEPALDVAGAWQKCTPETAADFSAVAYYFARDVHKATGVPIGIICASWGGTPGEPWLAPELTRNDPDYAALYAEWEEYRRNYPAIRKQYDADMAAYEKKMAEPPAAGKKPPAKPLSKPHPDENHKYPGVLFNGMIHPLAGLPIKGFLWYQGESNKDRYAQYRKLLASLITDWRKRWDQGDLPFLVVQLANFKPRATQPSDSGRTRLREAQAQVAREMPGCELAVTIDLGEAGDIHPLNKKDVGRRLALAALQKVYARDVVGSGPVNRTVEFRDGKANVEFDAAGGGLVSGPDGNAGSVEGFALAGKDRVWHWAVAQIEGNRVVVESPQVSEPVALRYAWADNPPAALYNKEGFPAVPFRTDDWPLAEDASGHDGAPE
jgi:sialate O-acetylesterase